MEKNKTISLNSKEVQQYIIKEAMKLMSDGDALDLEMNKMDKVVNSDGSALVKIKEKGGFEKKTDAPKAADNIEKTEEATDIKMNPNDKKGGSDEKVAAAVSVEATGSTKKGDSTEGMHNSKFESKDETPSKDASQPFEEKAGDKMNEMDKDGEEGAKTFVQPGSELSKGHSTGQHKADYSEEAKNEKEKAERIAKGIQLPEGFKNKKELINFINEEAKKLSKLI